VWRAAVKYGNGLLTTASRLVVLSPHLDDAVLSCGAVLASAAEATAAGVVTVFNGPPDGALSDAAREFHARCGHGDDAMAHRESEDDLAMKLLGVASVRLGLPEALYRRDASGEHRHPDIRSGVRTRPDGEPEVVDAVTERLRAVTAVEEADLLLVPLGIGNHIDHQIVATAAQNLQRPMLWYEDIPYALSRHYRGWEATLAPADALIHYVSAAQWQRKLDAVNCYASQQEILFRQARGFWREALTAYAVSVGGGVLAERYWWASP
jgi:LmbE family N-acetylglucosaminyl deacetylase